MPVAVVMTTRSWLTELGATGPRSIYLLELGRQLVLPVEPFAAPPFSR